MGQEGGGLRAGLRFAYGVGATAEVAGQAHPAPGGRGLLVLLGGGGPARLYSLLFFTSSATSIVWELVALTLSSAFVLHAAIVGVWLPRPQPRLFSAALGATLVGN